MGRSQRVKLTVLATVFLGLTGCASRSPTTQPFSSDPITILTADARTLVYRPVTPDDCPTDPDAAIMVHMDVYDIQVPSGAISGSSAFAALVDQQAIPAVAHDTLARNGIRAGMGNRNQWGDFRKLLDNFPATTTPTKVMGTTGRAELMIRREITDQTLFFTDAQGELVGRTYDVSENFWALKFSPVPHRPGWTGLGLCPVVRASRRRLEFTRNNSEVQIAYTQPEALYDVSLSTDVPLDKFLVIWPTADVRRQTTLLGNAFLLSGDYPKPMEHVLILTPQVFQFDEKATQKLRAHK